MTKWNLAIGFVLGAILAGAAPVVAEDVFRIEIGKSGRSSDTQWRLNRLELAVDQLQRKVFELENTRPIAVAPPASSYTTCYIKTTFDGTFTATEPTETAARAKAIKECSNKIPHGFACDDDKVKCGK